MASLTRSLGRSALSLSRRGPSAILPSRSFSVSPLRSMQEDPDIPDPPKEPRPEDLPPAPEYDPALLSKAERSMYDLMSPQDQAEFDAENRRMVADFNNIEKRSAAFAELEKQVNQIEKEYPMRFEDFREKRPGFWNDEEDDEFSLVEDADEENYDDDITSMGHAELELHREIRHYARIAAWDMPHLTEMSKPFSIPPETHILRFRYTTYMGEQHPAEPKVVVELSSKDLAPKYLTEEQRLTFLKLVGPRYNPETDIVRMSCEKFGNRAQNKRYLGDVVNNLIKEAKEGDSFADIPLDLRHRKPKKKISFPEEWIMTEERRKMLEGRRVEAQIKQSERNGIVDGKVILQNAALTLPSLNPALAAKATHERERVAVRAGGARGVVNKRRLR